MHLGEESVPHVPLDPTVCEEKSLSLGIGPTAGVARLAPPEPNAGETY